ncbi:MAG: hypothetical protein AB7P78_13205 [Candidatus Binatia bacterium]
MSRRSAQPARNTERTARAAPAASATAAHGWSHLAPLVTLPALAIALYLPCVYGEFVYDDLNSVAQNGLIRSLTPLTSFLVSTRPLTDFSLALNYAAGGLSPRPYHATHLLLHALNALCVYALAWIALGRPALAGRYGMARRAIAWAAGALFAAHPLASETVAYVSSRSEVLAAAWYLLGVLGYAVGATSDSPRARRAGALLVPVAGAAGLASKEIVVTLPAALLLFDWALLAGGDWRRTRPRWRLIGLATAPIAIVGMALLVRAYLGSSPLNAYGATAGPSFDRFTGIEYALTQFGAILHYLRLAVLPIGLTFDYEWPLARSPWSPGVLVPAVLLSALVVAAWRARRAQPLFTFGVLWTFLTLAPTSSVVPIADLVVERRMYLPLAGLMLCAAAWLYDLTGQLPGGWRRHPAAYAGVVALPLLLFAVLTWQRAALWGDAIALHEDGVRRAPENPRVRLNLGVTYLNHGRLEPALAALIEAKRLYDRGESVHAFPRIGAFIHYNLGATLIGLKRYDQAEPHLTRSVELGGQYVALRPVAYLLLSRVAAQRGDWDTAAAHIGEALRYRDDPNWRVEFAEITWRSGNPIGARMIVDAALERYPGFRRAEALRRRLDTQR